MQDFIVVLLGLLALCGLSAVAVARTLQASRLRRDNPLTYDVTGLSKTGDKVTAKFKATWRVTSVVRFSDREWEPLAIDILQTAIAGWMKTQTTTQLHKLTIGSNTDQITNMVAAADEIERVYGVKISKNILRSLP